MNKSRIDLKIHMNNIFIFKELKSINIKTWQVSFRRTAI